MFSLIIERGKYFKVKTNTEKSKIISNFNCPVEGEIFCGKIIPLSSPKGFIIAAVGDTYEKIAARERVSLTELKKLNSFSPVYPTKRVWLP